MNCIRKAIHLSLLAAALSSAENAAVSSYLDPVTSGKADVRIREVRMPSSGYTIGTYWCTLGYWTTGSTSGYGGLQWTPDPAKGPNNYIYSQWNDYSTAAYNDPATNVTTFGGEGTGVKSINNDPLNQWEPDYWHVTADRVWNEGNTTHFGFIVKNGKTGVWKHLMTWNTPEANLKLTGSYCFLEDWRGDGEYRESQIRKGWDRKSDTERWEALTTYKYNINDYDIAAPGRRSYNKRTNWAGGIKSDATGEFFYMGAGGTVSSTNNDETMYTIARAEKSPQEEYGVHRIADLKVIPFDNNSKLAVEWESDSLTVPQFIYTISVKQGSSTVLTKTDTLPQGRSDTLDISSLDLLSKSYTVQLDVVDFFDGNAIPFTREIGAEASEYLYIKTPQGGEEFEHGEIVHVEWISDLDADSVRISLLGNDRIDSLSVADIASGAGTVVIPDFTARNVEYRIVVTAIKNETIADTSRVFTVFVPDMDHQLIDQSTLSVYSFDSEQDNSASAANNVLDGNETTIWHTDWSATAMPPHEIVLKTDGLYKLTGLKYLPRQDGANGRIADYEIYVSIDGISWGDPIFSSTFENSIVEQEIHFTETIGQFVKLVALTEQAGQAWTSIAELNLLTSGEAGEVSIATSMASPKKSLLSSVSGKSVQLNLTNGVTYTLSLVQVNGRVLFNSTIIGSGVTSIDFSNSGVARGVFLLKIESINDVSLSRIQLN